METDRRLVDFFVYTFQYNSVLSATMLVLFMQSSPISNRRPDTMFVRHVRRPITEDIKHII